MTQKIGRRKFLGVTAGGVAASAVGAPARPAPALRPGAGSTASAPAPPALGEERRDAPAHGIAIAPDGRAVLEAPRRTPVAARVDVLVAGGGPAGVGAALAAARSGASTLVVERHGMLGGVWTAGLLNPLFDASGKGWLIAELVERLEQEGAWRKWRWTSTFDTETMCRLLEEMCAEAGARFWYHTLVTDPIVERGRVLGALVEGKSGREAILARTVIDCTGDGDVAARAGASYWLGRPGDGACQPMTLMFEIEGAGTREQRDTAELHGQLEEAIARAGLDIELPFDRVNYAPWIILLPRPDAAVVQATHVYRVNATDTRDITRATVEARRQARDLVRVLRHVPGFERVRLTHSAPAIGVREGRRIRGRYVLSLDDLRAGRRFDDAVTFCKFGVDIHEPVRGTGAKTAHHTPIRPYEIPYRCLVPDGLSGLLVAGRCISGTHEAHASYRVTGTCMAMGQAAGLAAALAAARNIAPDVLDGACLRGELQRRGAGFLA